MKKSLPGLNFILSIVMTALVIVAVTLMGDYYYDLNDDVLMKDILSGAYTGLPAGHNIQMLYPISAFIALFYRVVRALPWYGIFLCGCQFLCVFVLCYRTLSKCRDTLLKVEAGLMTLFVIMGTMASHMIFVQYTFTCGLMAATAAYLILMHDEHEGKRDLVCAVILLAIAYLIRSEMLLLTLPMICVAILIKWVLSCLDMGNDNSSGVEVSRYGEKRQFFKKYLGFLAAIIASLAAGIIINAIAYSSPEWKEFYRIFDARTELYDFQYIPDYAENKEFYDSIGLSESEQQLLINYNFGIDDEIDADILNSVAGYAAKLRTDEVPLTKQLLNALPLYLYRLRHVALQDSFEYPLTDAPFNAIVIVLYLGVFLLTVFSSEKEKKLPVTFLLLLLFACRSTLWLFIIVRGRDPIRITHPLYLVEIAILTGMLLVRASKIRKNAFIPIVIVGLIGFVFIPGQFRVIADEMTERGRMREHYGALYDYFEENSDSFYFVDVYTSVSAAGALEYSERTFSEKMFEDINNEGYNHDIMGGWASKSPLYYEKLERNGFTSMQDAILQDNVYVVTLVTDDTSWLTDYYREKGIETEIEQVSVIEDVFAIYSLSEVR